MYPFQVIALGYIKLEREKLSQNNLQSFHNQWVLKVDCLNFSLRLLRGVILCSPFMKGTQSELSNEQQDSSSLNEDRQIIRHRSASGFSQ